MSEGEDFMSFKRGSVRRIKLKNFLTYADMETRPGPRLVSHFEGSEGKMDPRFFFGFRSVLAVIFSALPVGHRRHYLLFLRCLLPSSTIL